MRLDSYLAKDRSSRLKMTDKYLIDPLLRLIEYERTEIETRASLIQILVSIHLCDETHREAEIESILIKLMEKELRSATPDTASLQAALIKAISGHEIASQ